MKLPDWLLYAWGFVDEVLGLGYPPEPPEAVPFVYLPPADLVLIEADPFFQQAYRTRDGHTHVFRSEWWDDAAARAFEGWEKNRQKAVVWQQVFDSQGE